MEPKTSIDELLEEQIRVTILEVASAKAGSAEARLALTKLDKLQSERIKELELNLKARQMTDASIAKMDELKLRNAELDQRIRQAEEDAEIRKQELAKKDDELREARKARRWKTLLDILGISVPTMATGWWLWRGMRFEEEGKIYSSRTGQWVSGIARLFQK